MSSKKIYLLRHGQTDYNLLGIIQGSGIDSSLNDTGRWQAQRFYEAYHEVPFDKIYTSALQRSIQSVQSFIDKGIPHEKHPELNEICWGNREGTCVTPETDVYYFDILNKWKQGHCHLAVDEGESPEDVATRQRKFLEVLLSRTEEETVLICMHGRAMRVFLCVMLNYPLHCMDIFDHHNLCLYVLHHTGTMFSIHKHMDIQHLGD